MEIVTTCAKRVSFSKVQRLTWIITQSTGKWNSNKKKKENTYLKRERANENSMDSH